ncbi:HopJ type III effector protein [Photobacterium halotolerans]|uniref:Type III effector n=1 Tax=Photobacterium halotolerans TaxID=265726 RepID=A0A7X4WCV9_9GAMM|nr:HopJ type III effector protein [Photobacterium halotolerans]NAW65535.1 type III effector [Photobacterium halotolerans]NAW85893.1 type III effector [Photobacterium halotolerans]
MDTLLKIIKESPSSVVFDNVLSVIDQHYEYRPTAFSNGLGNETLANEAGSNEGSCRIFAFAQQHKLSEQETLACFGHHYFDTVLNNPDGTDHMNIRTFMKYGWRGIRFAGQPLKPKHSVADR